MDYTVEFDSELLEQFPQEEYFMYKEAIFHKVTEYLEHDLFRIEPACAHPVRGIYETKVKINKKNCRIVFALKENHVFIFYISSNLQKIVLDREASKKIE